MRDLIKISILAFTVQSSETRLKDGLHGLVMELARFKKPTHQISFHTEAALATLSFVRGDEVHES